jgi:succinoglycan biosynthesis protein ExoM
LPAGLTSYTMSVEKPVSDHISVCICTYRRQRMLERLLRNLAIQDMEYGLSFSAVVVDNDPDGSAEVVVSRMRAELGLDIAFDIEQERTIPAARNHAVRLAKGSHIGIVDDDEFPSRHWLLSLYRAIRAFEVDGALGPVYPFFEQPPPAWLLRSGMVNLPHWPTGTLLQWTQTRTGNALLKREVFDRHSIRFDESFRTGGSDQAFFRRAMELGFRFVAVRNAPVYEIVPPERWSRSYFLNRALVNGFNSWKYMIGQSRAKMSMAALKSALAVVTYGAALPVCALLGSHVLMNSLQNGLYHVSRLAAVMGIELRKRRDF